MSSILLVIELHALSPPGLARALMLTRYLHTRLDILVYPQLSVPARSPAQVHRWREEERQCLDALRRSILAPDIEIAIELASRGTLKEAIFDKVQQTHYALIIKSLCHRPPSRRDLCNWELMRHCPVPFLLTAGRPWHPKPRFLAAIGGLNSRSLDEGSAVLEAANALKLACAAELDLVHVAGTNSHEPIQQGSTAPMQFERLVKLSGVPASGLHQLAGRSSESLRQFATDGEYDLLIVDMSALFRASWSSSTGSAIVQALSAADCDLLTIQDSDGARPLLSGRRRLRWNPFPFWQWAGAD